MAYVLGLIFSDGAIEDVRKSSRTCYLSITSKDRSLLTQVRKAMSSNHRIYTRQPLIKTFGDGKSYLCSKVFYLRIGNKNIFQDLINLGVTPRKSLRMRFPNILDRYLGYFIRGYLDGDGCINTYLPKGRKTPKLSVIFTSGSQKFLLKLSEKISKVIEINTAQPINHSNGAFDIRYCKSESLKILAFIYNSLEKAPYLGRKYNKYQEVKNIFI